MLLLTHQNAETGRPPRGVVRRADDGEPDQTDRRWSSNTQSFRQACLHSVPKHDANGNVTGRATMPSNAFMSGPAGRMVEALKARVARGIHLIVHRLQTFEFGLDGCVLGVDGRHACVRSVA